MSDDFSASQSVKNSRLALGVAALGFLASVVCIVVSPDGVHHFDDLTHFLYAKWAWRWPGYLLDHWGRPGFTGLYAPAAALGWTACRILSAGLSAAAGWFAFRIAQHAGLRHAWAAVLLTWIQPLYFQLSQTTLTETPLAFYLSAAVLLAIRGRWGWSSAMLSLCFVTRHEAVLFLPIWAAFAWFRGVSLWRLWTMLWAPVFVNTAAWSSNVTTIVELYLRPKPSGQYGTDGWFTFFARSLHAWGPAVSALAWTGIAAFVWRRVTDRSSRTHPNGVGDPVPPSAETADATPSLALRAWTPTTFALSLTTACIVAYFAAQTVIRVFGLFDSGGYARFLVPIGPLVGVAALAGWNGIISRDRREQHRYVLLLACSFILLWIALELQVGRHAGLDIEFPVVRGALVAMRTTTAILTALALLSIAFSRGTRWVLSAGIIALACITLFIFHRPLRTPDEAPLIEGALAELKKQGLGDRPIESALQWIDLLKGQAYPPTRGSTRSRIEQAPIGTLVAWESQFAGSHDHGLRLEEFLESPSFRPVLETAPKPFRPQPYLYIFEKVGVSPVAKSAETTVITDE
ncbi:MAG TPA: hypothetical protein VNT79_11680 [Phycisphaerae bacterium]|nr:hypothetical protein [Phycisphaerae bacterium]